MGQELTVQMLIDFVIIFVFTFVGSLLREVMAFLAKRTKIRPLKVISSAFGMAIFTWAGTDELLKHASAREVLGLSCLFGFLSYSILVEINSLQGLNKVIADLAKVVKSIFALFELKNNLDGQFEKTKE